MLDIRFIRENLDVVRTAFENRNYAFDLGTVVKLDDERKKLLAEVEALRAQQNKANDDIGSVNKGQKRPQAQLSSP